MGFKFSFKVFVFFIFVFLTCVGEAFGDEGDSVEKNEVLSKSYCPFCDPKVIQWQNFLENENAIGLYDHKPIKEGHCLIIPKRHVVRFEELTAQEIVSIYELIKKTNGAVEKGFNMVSYLILQKNGREAGQGVFHVHFHYIPMKKDESPFTLLYKIPLHEFCKKPISQDEMRKHIEIIKKNL